MKVHSDGIYYGKYKETEDDVYYRGRYTWGGVVQVLVGAAALVVLFCVLVVVTGVGTINLGTIVIGG